MQGKSFREVLAQTNRKYLPVQEPKQKEQYIEHITLEELITPQGRLMSDINAIRSNLLEMKCSLTLEEEICQRF